MRKPTTSQLRELQSLRNNAEIVDFLEGSLEDAKERLVTMQDSDAIRTLQGEARAYQKLLSHVKS